MPCADTVGPLWMKLISGVCLSWASLLVCIFEVPAQRPCTGG